VDNAPPNSGEATAPEGGETPPPANPLEALAGPSQDPDLVSASPPAEIPEATASISAPASISSREVLGEIRLLLSEERLEECDALLVPLLRQDPGNRSARLMISIVRSLQGRSQEALTALEDLRGMDEDLPLLLALGGAYFRAGRHYDALLTLDRAIRLHPEHPHAYVNLAWLRLAINAGEAGGEEAEAFYRQAVRLGARRDRQLERRLGFE